MRGREVRTDFRTDNETKKAGRDYLRICFQVRDKIE
jgi:hypothetical protein